MTALNIIVIANYPLEKHYILASLVKGRWLDGKAQALILLLSACDMSNIFMLQTFLPSRRRDCLISTASPYNTLFQNRTIPCFALSHLPPLSKVRCCRPKKFGRLPEGLPHLHRLALQHPFQNRTIPRKALSPLPLNERFVGFASVQSWSFAVGASCTDFLRPLVSIRA